MQRGQPMQDALPKTNPFTLPDARTLLRGLLRALAPLVTVGVLLGGWQAVTVAELYPAFIIPPPSAVFGKAVEVTFGDSRVDLWPHVWATLRAVLLGLAFGLTSAVSLGYLVAKNRLLESMLSPVIVAFQATPVVAYAPLLVIWFGSGVTSKVITSALIVFFPSLMNTVVGLRGVPTSLRDLMRSLQATRAQMFTKLEVPAAMPVLLSGLKVSATLAVIGAVVGEFVSANAGLGYLINLARSQYDTALVFVSVFALTLMALSLYGIVTVMERFALAWQKHGRG